MSDNLEKAPSESTEEPDRKEPKKRSGASPNRKRSLLSLRNILIAAALGAVGFLVLAGAAAMAFRLGAVDSYVKDQFVAAFDDMGVAMKTDRFALELSPFRLNVEKALFTNKRTGAKLVEVENMNFDLTLLDLFAFSTIRNVSIDRTELSGVDVWIDFDENGKSNYEGIEILPPKNNVRLQYASTEVALRDGTIHFGDIAHSISGNAKNFALFLKPDAERPPDSKDIGFLFELASKDSSFIYDKNELRPVDINAAGRLHEAGAEISRLTLKTPVGSSTLSGKVDDWRRLKYDLNVSSTIDLTQSSSIFPMGTAIAGIGDFEGRVVGEGEKYRVVGEVTSDSLAASNIRLKALKITADGNGEGTMYRANGKAVAELLTFEDFRIEFPSLIGNVRGTGTDFKWFGELQAAAVKSPLGTIGSLIISDGVAEYEDNRLIATLGNVRARKFSNDSVNLESIQTGNIRIISSNGTVDAVIPRVTAMSLNVDDANMRGITVDSARVGTSNGKTDVSADRVKLDDFQSGDTKLRNTRAGQVNVQNQNGRTNVTAANIETDEILTKSSKATGVSALDVTVAVDQGETRIDSRNVRLARVETGSAILANLNIAGVRLTVRDGVIEGETSDFEAGDIELGKNRSLNQVAVKKPVFVLEPSGRYRASLDMTLGGGIIGDVRLGAASASVVADNDLVQLNELKAEVMNGKIDGTAKIALSDQQRSELIADFEGLDISKILALQGGQVVPLEGKTNGRAELTFRGTDFRRASGNLTADIKATAGTEDRGFIPVDGRLGVSANDGLFDIDYANLSTRQSTFSADGRFDLNGSDSRLVLALDSANATEIERIVRVLNVSPEIEKQLDSYEISPEGALAFNGKLTGDLANPTLDGRASLASLIVRGRDLGTLVTNLDSDPDRFQFRDGVLQARDGGTVKFGANIPTSGSNNVVLEAALNDVDLANLIVVIPKDSIPSQLRDVEGRTTGTLNLSGLPNDLSGEASLFTRNGAINGQSFANLTSVALFEGKLVKLSQFDADFGNGSLSAKGFYKSDTTEFDVDLTAQSIPAQKILAFFPKSDSAPVIDGNINATGKATGQTSDSATYNVNFSGAGSGISINKSRFGRIDFEGQTQDRIFNATATTNLSGKKQLITARLDFSDERLPFRAETNLVEAPVTPYLAIFRPFEPDSVAITGILTGKIEAAGDLTAVDSNSKRVFTWDNVSGKANLAQALFQFDETPLAATETVLVNFNTSEIVFENAKFSGSGSNLAISGSKAFTDSGINNLAIDGKVNLGIIRAFSRNTLKNIFLSGIADVAVRLSGVNRTSRLNGTALLENGSAATFIGPNRVTFERVNGRVRFTTNQVQIEQVTAFLGGGKVTASGGALLNDDLALDKIRLQIRGANITVPLPTDFVTTGNADIEINGRLDGNNFGSFVSGTVITRRSVYRKDIDLADLIRGRRDAILAQSTDSGTSGDINYASPRLDIRIIGRDALRIRNNLADLSATADMRLTGDTETPRLSGRITASSGTIFFRDDRYEVRRGVLTFPPNTNIDPRINLQVESEIRGYQVFVNLSGSLSDSDSIKAVTSSNPSLPQADVTSLITTGNLSNTGAGIPTIARGGLNTAAEILTDEIINKPIARATDKLFGLNRFELDPIVSGQRGNPTARLTVGRQINRNLLATYSTNLSQDQNQVLALEYRVSNRLSFIAAYEQRSLTNVTQNRDKFSFEIRLRKRF